MKECLGEAINFRAVHDDAIVPPGAVITGGNKPFKAFSPWLKACMKHIHEHPHLLNEFPGAARNAPIMDDRLEELFSVTLPHAPLEK